MSKKTSGNLIVGLDIGTSKVVAIVGEVTVEGGIDIIGIGMQPSRGLKKGVVVNIESTVQSIQRAVEEAELMAGCQIRSVFAGPHSQYQFARNCRDQGKGSDNGRCGARYRSRQGGRDSG